MNVQGYSPLISAPVQAQTASSSATSGSNGTSGTTGSSGTSNGNNSLSSSSLETTFLNLLVTELQNQDPTQPVDPTEMVGQMVSLNQLDQLISINQTLTSLTGGVSTASPNGSSTPQTSAANVPANAQTQAAATPQFFGTAGGAQQGVNPAAVPPGTLMNLYGNGGFPANNSTFAISGGR